MRTPGFAGADLANVINEAALLAARRNKSAITMEELDEAVERTMAGLERKSRVLSEGERRVVAYHEAGHAIVGEVLPHANPVQKISIVSRGAALGYVLHMPTEDRYLKSKDEILDEICMALGGRVAEEIVFEGVTSGAANDLQRATQLAERMVKEFGMSERLGLVSHKEERNQQFLGMGANDRQYSEETAREIDKEIARIMQESKDRAREVLNERRNILDDLVEILFKNEVMDGDELRDLLNRTNGEAEVGKEGAEEAEGKDLNNSSAEAPQEVN